MYLSILRFLKENMEIYYPFENLRMCILVLFFTFVLTISGSFSQMTTSNPSKDPSSRVPAESQTKSLIRQQLESYLQQKYGQNNAQGVTKQSPQSNARANLERQTAGIKVMHAKLKEIIRSQQRQSFQHRPLSPLLAANNVAMPVGPPQRQFLSETPPSNQAPNRNQATFPIDQAGTQLENYPNQFIKTHGGTQTMDITRTRLEQNGSGNIDNTGTQLQQQHTGLVNMKTIETPLTQQTARSHTHTDLQAGTGKFNNTGNQTARQTGTGKVEDTGNQTAQQTGTGTFTNMGKQTAQQTGSGKFDNTGNQTAQQTGTGKFEETGSQTAQQTESGKFDSTGNQTAQQTETGKFDNTGNQTAQQTRTGKFDNTGNQTAQQTGTGKFNNTGIQTAQQTGTGTFNNTGTQTAQQTGTGTFNNIGTRTAQQTGIDKVDITSTQLEQYPSQPQTMPDTFGGQSLKFGASTSSLVDQVVEVLKVVAAMEQMQAGQVANQQMQQMWNFCNSWSSLLLCGFDTFCCFEFLF